MLPPASTSSEQQFPVPGEPKLPSDCVLAVTVFKAGIKYFTGGDAIKKKSQQSEKINLDIFLLLMANLVENSGLGTIFFLFPNAWLLEYFYVQE